MANVSELVGQVVKAITGGVGDDRITFAMESGAEYAMYHSQDCCESVSVEDIAGDISDLIGSPILSADEVSNSGGTSASNPDPWPDGIPEPDYRDESYTWTFYRFQTIKGGVTIRWYGTSNGYYGESAYFEQTIDAPQRTEEPAV